MATDPIPTATRPPTRPGGPPPEPERLNLSKRVILHLFAQGRLGDDEVATDGFTQAGMSERLNVGQSPLSNVLRRLVVGGVLRQDVRHVFGRPRRLRVYRLTAMGEALANELRRRQTDSSPRSGAIERMSLPRPPPTGPPEE